MDCLLIDFKYKFKSWNHYSDALHINWYTFCEDWSVCQKKESGSMTPLEFSKRAHNLIENADKIIIKIGVTNSISSRECMKTFIDILNNNIKTVKEFIIIIYDPSICLLGNQVVDITVKEAKWYKDLKLLPRNTEFYLAPYGDKFIGDPFELGIPKYNPSNKSARK